MLRFSPANAKLIALQRKKKKRIYSFSILSGHNCPFAKLCHSRAVETENGMRIQDGEFTEWRCYSASQEILFPALYKQRKHNADAIKACGNDVNKIAELIQQSLPPKAEIIRLHIGGDFFTQAYFDAWLLVAKNNPKIIFYTYTKSLPFWVKRINDIPKNFLLTASYGGYRDDLIEKYNLKSIKVVFSKAEAKQLKLPLDHDDSHALGNKSFAILIHGTQPKNSKANISRKKLRKKNGRYVGSYNLEEALGLVA